MRPLTFAVIVAFFTCPLFAQVDLNSGLVSCYSFTGNADDGSGHGHDGTVGGATLTNDRHGKPGKAYQFDGNDFITIPAQPLINPNYTYAFWAKTTVPVLSGESNVIFSIGDETSRHQTVNFSNSYGTAGFVGINVGGYNNGTPPTTSVQSGVDPVINRWYHVVSVRTNSEMRMYVDGNFIGATSTNLNTPYYGNLVTANIGTRCTFIQSFIGAIDDVVLYDRPLSEAEIQELYINGIPCELPDLPTPKLVSGCAGSFTLTVENCTTCRWYDSEIGGNFIFEGNPFTGEITQNTTYYVSNTVGGSETLRSKITVSIFPQPYLNCNFSDSLFTNEEHFFTVVTTNGTAPYEFDFDFGDSTAVHTLESSESHKYEHANKVKLTVKVTDANGCETICSSDVIVVEEKIFIPNVITPDDDSFNQTFTLYLRFGNTYRRYHGEKKFHMEIYNRWGKEIFTTDDILAGWQGGKNSTGVYFYTIKFGTVTYKGWVQVLL